jgi:ribosome maturation factor RimP
MDLTHAARDALEPLGYEVLEVVVTRRGASRRVLVRIDRLDEQAVSVDDVGRAAAAFGLELDRLDPFDDPYQFEVESPGAQRPLATARHFERFHDLLEKVKDAGAGFVGRVRGVEGDEVLFEVDGEAALRRVALAAIEQANLAEWPSTPR